MHEEVETASHRIVVEPVVVPIPRVAIRVGGEQLEREVGDILVYLENILKRIPTLDRLLDSRDGEKVRQVGLRRVRAAVLIELLIDVL